MFDANERLEEIYKRYGVNWDFVVGKEVSYSKLKKCIQKKCIKLIEENENPIVITTDEVNQWLTHHVRKRFEYVNQEKYKNVADFERNRAVILITTNDYSFGVENYVWYKGFHKNLNIYYLMELDGVNINFDITRIISYGKIAPHLKVKRTLKNFIQYKSQYSEKIRQMAEKLGKFRGDEIGGVDILCLGRNNPDNVIRAINEKYRMEYCSEGTKYFMKKLIVFLLIMRDFPSAYEYIDRYASLYLDDEFETCQIKSELEKLFDDMAKLSESLPEGNIIVNWVDNVQYERLCDLPWIKSQIEEGIKLENSFSTMPWTSWVTKILFAGEGAVSGRLYKRGRMGENSGEFTLIDYLKQKGYDVKFSARYSNGSKLFVKEMLCKTEGIDESKLSTRAQWFGVCEMLKNQKTNTFLILHNMLETHSPYASIEAKYIDWKKPTKCTEEQKMENRKYIDKRIEWYSRFYGNKSTCIWMSDHGDAWRYDERKDSNDVWNLSYFDDARTRVFFGISGYKVKKCHEKRFFTFECFKNLIKYIIENTEDKYRDIFVPYVSYEAYDTYSGDGVDKQLTKPKVLDGKIQGQWQHVGIRDEYYKYIRFFDGTELFYVLPDEQKNEIANPVYSRQIDEMRDKIAGKKFINIYEEDFFKESRRLYAK